MSGDYFSQAVADRQFEAGDESEPERTGVATFLVVEACAEVGPKDVLLCSTCFGASTVYAYEVDPADADGPLVCASCGVSSDHVCEECGSTHTPLTNYYAGTPCPDVLLLCEDCTARKAERAQAVMDEDSYGGSGTADRLHETRR